MDLDSLSYYKYGAFISVLRYSVLRYWVFGTPVCGMRYGEQVLKTCVM